MGTQQTFGDAVQRLADRYQFNSSQPNQGRKARDAVRAAYRDLPSKYHWSYLRRRTRLTVSASYSTGTIDIDASTRTVTLDDGTWPSWAKYGELIVGTSIYKASSVSGDEMILAADRCPASDVAAGTTYQLQRTTYPLPADFRRHNDLFEVSSGYQPTYVPVSDAGRLSSLWYKPGTSYQYTILGSQPDYPGRMTIQFAPASSTDKAFDLIYESSGRPFGLREAYVTGTASISSGGTTITGVGTVFPSNCEGCIIRLGTASALPSGAWGDNPAVYEGYIVSRVSDTSLIVDVAADAAASAVRFSIDDPIDIEQNSMQSAFDLLCQANYADMAQLQSANDSMQKFLLELQRARAADDRDQRRYGANSDPATALLASMYGGF